MKKNFRQKNKGPAPYEAGGFRLGFTLIETLVALSIFTVSILGLFGVLTRGSADINYAKQKMAASYLAQEGIEYVRNMRDTYVLYEKDFIQFRNDLNPCTSNGNACGFDTVFPHDVTGCNQFNGCRLYINSNGGYDTISSGIPSNFIRKIWKENVGNGQDQVKIFSTVEWTQGSGTHNVTFSEDLLNWAE